MASPITVVNQALAEIGQEQTIASGIPSTSFDGSSTGITAGLLYQPAINMLLRSQDYEFAKAYAIFVPITSVPIPPPWTHMYALPNDCVRVRQVLPQTWDALDPQAVLWDVQDQLISAVSTRVILCNIANAAMYYTTNNIIENQWDPMFAEVVVRYLASELVIAIGGRPDLSEKKLVESGQIMSSDVARDS